MPTAIVKKDKKQKKKDGEWTSKKGVLTKKDYEQELRRLQVELVQLEEWSGTEASGSLPYSRAATRRARGASSSA